MVGVVAATATLGFALATTVTAVAKALVAERRTPVAWRAIGDKKVPVGGKGWHTLTPEQGREAVERRPDGNVGLLVEGDLVVVDIDGEDGLELFLESVPEGALPLGPRVQTGKGWHIYYRVDNLTGLGQRTVPRGKGGVQFFCGASTRYVGLPPSVHPNGKVYTWVHPELPVPDLPREALAWLLRVVIPEGTRNVSLTSEVGRLFASGKSKDAVRDGAHAWNEQSCEPPLPEREVDAIVESIARRQAEADAEAHDAVDAAVANFNNRWALVLHGKNTVLETPPRGRPAFYEFNRWKRHYANQQVAVPTSKGTRKVPLVDVWLTHPHRRSYQGVVLDPLKAAYSGVPARRGGPGDEDFNLWPGFALTPSEDGSCELFLTHLREIVCGGDADLNQWVLTWLGHMVQRPECLAGTALALRGPQGTGKSVVGDIMGTILGDPLYVKVSKPDELTGRFNAHHEGRLLLQVEEGFWAGDHKAEGALKNMITSKTITVEPKFVDSFVVENFMRLLVTSNKDWVVPAGFGERRFAVLDVSDTKKDDRAYHGAMRREMFEEGGCARLLHYLLHEVTVDESLIWRPPVTAALAEQQVESLGGDDTWLMDILSRGEVPGDADGKGCALTDLVFDHYIQNARNLGWRSHRSSATKLGSYLKNKSGVAVGKVRVERRLYYVFPPLADCRAAFAARLAREVDWLNDATEWRPSQWGGERCRSDHTSGGSPG